MLDGKLRYFCAYSVNMPTDLMLPAQSNGAKTAKTLQNNVSRRDTTCFVELRAEMTMHILMITHHRLWRAAYRSRVMAEGLARRGHEVTLMVVSDENRRHFDDEVSNGVRIVQSPDLFWGRGRSGWDPLSILRRNRWLQNDDSPYDVIHLFETRPATIFPGLAARKRLGAPLIIDWIDWWGRGGIINLNRPWWYRKIFAGLETFFEEHYRTRADASTVISYGLRDRATGLGVPADSIVHLRNGGELDKFRPVPMVDARRKLSLPEDTFIVGYAAQDTFFDLDPMFEGFAKFANRIDKPAMFAMSGNAPARSRRAVQQFGLGKRANFLGYLSTEDYATFLPACDVLAVPFPGTIYNIGRWPGKFGEYAASGRPIVFNPEGDLKDFTGDLAPGIACEFTADAFADAFQALYDDADLKTKLGKRARELAQSHLDWEMVVDRLEELYVRTTTTPHGVNTGARSQAI